jgi:superfamily I DNA/RNA helicase
MSKLSSPAVDNAPHLIVEARAGTGKTTTLIEGLKRLRGVPTPGFVPSPEQEAVFRSMELSRGFDRTIGFVAFNKSIATELQSRVPRGCEAKTMHGMGYSAVRRAFGNVDVTGDKVPPRVLTILEEIEGKNIRELRKENNVLVKAVERLVSLCKMNLTDATEPRNLDDLAAHYDVELNGSREKVYSLVPRILDRCKDVARDNAVDFDDMIWIPVVLDLPVFRFDILLVDEAQDLNRCQQALAKKAGKRLILCGDPFQAIYGFAGADSDSMPRMERELSSIPCSGSRTPNCECQGCRENRRQGLRGCVVLPLTVTRRCGRAIVKEAQRLVPTFSAHESNPEGKVTMMRYPLQPGAKWGTAIQIKIEDTYVPHVKDGDMVICRTNAPLVRECLRFIRLGKRATIQGRDVGQGIINVVLKMDASSIPDLMTKLDGWYSKEVAKERAKDHPREHYIESLADKRECIVSLMDGASTVDEVVKKIESIFSDKTDLPGILLSSIHRAKGLESKTVFFLSPDVQPRRPAEKMQPHELEQEKNLEYVGITRAIEHLVRVY